MARPKTKLLLALLCLPVLALLAQPALSALPVANGSFEAHDHSVKGKQWHVQAQIGKNQRLATIVVAYDEVCGETLDTSDIPIAADGTMVIDVAAKTRSTGGEDQPGRLQLNARFKTAHHLHGQFRISEPDCDTGWRNFDAHHGRAGSGHTHGHAAGEFPDLSTADPAKVRAVRRLWKESVRVAHRRFPSYRMALSNRYDRFRGDRAKRWRRPMIFHVRNAAYEVDGRVLDPHRPESLVYWWPKSGAPVLIGFMYRAPAPGRPRGGDLFAWHRHKNRYGKWGDNQMTHVWLTADLRSALANCLPTEALERSRGRFGFRFETPGHGGAEHESKPCKMTGATTL